MKTIKFLLLQFCCTVLVTFSGNTVAQGLNRAQLQTELISTWLVTVEGEERARLLRITAAAPSSENTLLLEAVYGWIDGKQSSVVASVVQSGPVAKLELTTQANSIISAAMATPTVFEGTFTTKSGTVKTVKLQKIDESELQARINAAKTAAVEKAAQVVPEHCAAFKGKWEGNWAFVGFAWLWVARVDANCVVRLSYTLEPQPPKTYYTNRIVDGVLKFSGSSGSSFVFERHGEELWASYSNAQGQRNNTVFKRVQLDIH